MPFEEKHEYIYVPCDTLKRFFPGADRLVLDQRGMMELYRSLKAEVESCEQIVGSIKLSSVADRKTAEKTNDKINKILDYAKTHAAFMSNEIAVHLAIQRKYAAMLLDLMYQRRMLVREQYGTQYRYSLKPEDIIVLEKKLEPKEA